MGYRLLALSTSSRRSLGINLRYLRTLMEDTPAQNVLLILEACHSGVISQEHHSLTRNAVEFRPFSLEGPSASTRCVLAAGQSSARVRETSSLMHGAFTAALLKQLRSADATGTTVGQLFDHLTHDLSLTGHPNPVLFSIQAGIFHFPPPSTSWQVDATQCPLPDWLSGLVRSAPYPLAGDESCFIRDVNLPDGVELPTGATIVKEWEIRNVGTVPWRNRFVTASGSNRGVGLIEVQELTPIQDTMPGDKVVIRVSMRMPSYPGTVHARFKMCDAAGNLFFPHLGGLFVTYNVVYPDRPPQGASS